MHAMIDCGTPAPVNRVLVLRPKVNKVLTSTMLIVVIFAVAQPIPILRPTAIVAARAQILQAERIDFKTLRPRKRNPAMRTLDFE
ncbi:MAG: hypothetical protein ACKVOJ_10320 [Sphingomonadaceae bacterium]